MHKESGPAARGKKRNPDKPKKGREAQRRRDEAVMSDVARFYQLLEKNINPWEKPAAEAEEDDETEEGAEEKKDTKPSHSLGAQSQPLLLLQ
jgi:hypothetical protein